MDRPHRPLTRGPQVTETLPAEERSAQLDQLVEALVVEPIGTDTFTAQSPDWWGDRVFGGMVVGQSLSAAIQCVAGLRPHSLHGYFLRPVQPGTPTTLTVERVRDSRSFAIRCVTARQHGKETSRFTCSFHVAEDGDEYQVSMPAVPAPEDIPHQGDPPGPIDNRELEPVRHLDGTFASTRRVWLRPCAALPDDDAVHACVAAFMSDMTHAAFRPQSMDTWGSHTDASLDHALWLHRPVRLDDWVFYDLQAVVNGAGRATVRGTLYDRQGALCISMAQELLIRRLPGQGGPAPWLTAQP